MLRRFRHLVEETCQLLTNDILVTLIGCMRQRELLSGLDFLHAPKYVSDFEALWEGGNECLDEVVQRNLGLVPDILHNSSAAHLYCCFGMMARNGLIELCRVLEVRQWMLTCVYEARPKFLKGCLLSESRCRGEGEGQNIAVVVVS